jgi:hypothetical protein
MIRGLEIDCGCFGAGSEVNAYRIVEDIVLLLMSVYLAKHPSDKFTLPTLFIKKNKKSMQMPGA